jgi:hypothetical protein
MPLYELTPDSIQPVRLARFGDAGVDETAQHPSLAPHGRSATGLDAVLPAILDRAFKRER